VVLSSQGLFFVDLDPTAVDVKTAGYHPKVVPTPAPTPAPTHAPSHRNRPAAWIMPVVYAVVALVLSMLVIVGTVAIIRRRRTRTQSPADDHSAEDLEAGMIQVVPSPAPEDTV
jgi:hypothetical protein